MLSLSAKIRKISGKKVKNLRGQGILPAVLYGPKTESESLKVDLKEFKKIYKEAGESSLISLRVNKETREVLIHDTQRHPLTDEFIHVDFYEPLLKEKVEATIPLIFEGKAPAVEELGGTLIKNISEIEVKGLPEELPKEIRVNIENLKTFDDDIFIRDLKVKKGIKILKEPNEVVASVAPPRKEEKKEKVIEEVLPEEEAKVEEKPRGEKKEKEEK